MKDVNCSKCKFDCCKKIIEVVRQDIFDLYWGLEGYVSKRGFICQHVENHKSARKSTGRKQTSNAFYFPVDLQKVRVCKKCLNTLDIGKKVVEFALRRKTLGVF